MAVEEFIPENWVIFRLGERKVLHFSDHAMVTRVLTDPVTGAAKQVESLTMYVDIEDGKKVSKMLSVLSRKLASELSAYIPNRRYLQYEFVIEKPEAKYAPPYLVEVRPKR